MLTARRAIFWLALLVAPHIAVLAWVFRSGETSPRQYLSYFYNFSAIDSGWPVIWAAPLYLLVLGALAAIAAPRERTSERGIGAMLLVFAGIGLAASPLVFGSGLLVSLARVLPGGLMLAAALAMGFRIIELPWFAIDATRSPTVLERFVLAGALGLGSLALLVFVLGTAGLLSPYLWWPLLLIAVALGARPFWQASAQLHFSIRTFSARNPPVAVGAVVIVVLFLLAHVALLWSPPLDYDVLEYHLGGPAQHFRAGRAGQIAFLDENLYANMPANAEMLFLLPMALLGGRLEGLPAAHFMVFAAWALTTAAVYALTVRLLRPAGREDAATPSAVPSTAGSAAALLFLIVPMGSELACDFYVEHPQALFHIAALLCACAFLQERTAGVRAAFGWLMLSGFLSGFGIGVKYPALLFTLAPLLIFVFGQLLLAGNFYEALRAALSLGVPAVTVLSPWMVRNGLASGDLFFPLGKVMWQRWSPGSSLPTRFDALEVALRSGRNDPQGWLDALKSLWPGLGKAASWLLGLHAGPHLLAWIPAGIGALFVFRSRAALLVFFVFAWDLAAWVLCTHRVERFFFPCLAPLAVFAGLGFAAIWIQLEARKLLVALVAVALLAAGPLSFFVLYSFSRPDAIVGADHLEDAARRQYHLLGNGISFEAWRAVDALPADSRTLFIGEAQTFYPRQTPEYATVFDTPVFEEILSAAKSGADVARMLQARGITHLYINAFEWSRLDRTYALQRRSPGESASGWKRAEISPELRKELDKLLAERRYEEYAATWPDGVLPGYLLLSDGAYARLENFIQLHTSRVWSSELLGVPGFEIRAVIK